MTKLKRLLVETRQGHAGRLDRESQFVFNYETAERSCEVALSMPIRAKSYAGNVLPAAFAMNLPEGYLYTQIQRHMAKHELLDEMRMLAIIGQNQIGRLCFLEPDAEPRALRPQVSLTEVLESEKSEELFAFLVDSYLGSGISGVQPKVMIPDAAAAQEKPHMTAKASERKTVVHSDLIIKSGGDEYPELAANEFLCMDAARRAGILTPEFWLSNDARLFVMKRFDLQGDDVLGFEDMTVLSDANYEPTGRYKYQGKYENLALIIKHFCRDNASESLARLYEYIALSVMVGNGDAHLKNFGVLYAHPAAAEAPRLAPLFDVVTTTVYDYVNPQTGRVMTDRTLALKLNKSNAYPDRKTLLGFGATQCLVKDPKAVIERIADAMTATLVEHGDRLGTAMRARLHEEWDRGRRLS